LTVDRNSRPGCPKNPVLARVTGIEQRAPSPNAGSVGKNPAAGGLGPLLSAKATGNYYRSKIMSLLQKILTEIEDEAIKKSAIAIAHASTICELESLADTLRKHGATNFYVTPVIHTHHKIDNPESVSMYIHTYDDHEAIIDALHAAKLAYTVENSGSCTKEQKTILRILGMTPHIELIGYWYPIYDQYQPQQEAA
jgi:hypothetical protein